MSLSYRYGFDTMDIATLANRLGLSEMQTRRLLSALGDHIDPFITRGAKRKIQVDAGAVAMLERARDLKNDGVPYRQLSDEIDKDFNGANGSAVESVNGTDKERENGPDNRRKDPDKESQGCPICAERNRLIGELYTRIEHLEAELHRERDRADRLEQLALPGPRRGPFAWVADLFRGEA